MTNASNYVSGPACTHPDATHVFDIGKVHVWGGSRAEVMDQQDRWDLMVSCAGNSEMFKPKNPLTFAETVKSFLPAGLLAVPVPPWIAIDWPDGGTPALGKGWWTELVDYFRSVESEMNVCFYCVGGHGRTGTALAMLATLSGAAPATSDPVKWLRKRYCAKAVETAAQIDYIERLTKMKIKAVGSNYLGNKGPVWQTPIGGTAKAHPKEPALTVLASGRPSRPFTADDASYAILFEDKNGQEIITVHNADFDPEKLSESELATLGYLRDTDGTLIDMWKASVQDPADRDDEQDWEGSHHGKL